MYAFAYICMYIRLYSYIHMFICIYIHTHILLYEFECFDLSRDLRVCNHISTASTAES